MWNDFDLKLAAAEDKAAELIDEYGICAPEHIRLRDIAYDKKAFIVEERVSGAVASIVKLGKHATIRISPGDSEERKRFSIAHELGHLEMNHLKSIQRICNNADMQNWYEANQESQANFFASELILPTKLVADLCDVKAVNFEPVRLIAQEFRASLTATAIKFIRLCPEQCAVVFSTEGRIKWFYKSSEWFRYIKKGDRLDDRTIAYDFFAGEAMEREPVEVESHAWIEDDDDEVENIVEHSIASPRFGFVLTLLWIRP